MRQQDIVLVHLFFFVLSKDKNNRGQKKQKERKKISQLTHSAIYSNLTGDWLNSNKQMIKYLDS